MSAGVTAADEYASRTLSRSSLQAAACISDSSVSESDGLIIRQMRRGAPASQTYAMGITDSRFDTA
jgi:hypothetical protein